MQYSLRGEAPVSESVSFDLGEFAEKITLGGWLGMIGASAVEGLRFVSDYKCRTYIDNGVIDKCHII